MVLKLVVLHGSLFVGANLSKPDHHSLTLIKVAVVLLFVVVVFFSFSGLFFSSRDCSLP